MLPTVMKTVKHNSIVPRFVLLGDPVVTIATSVLISNQLATGSCQTLPDTARHIDVARQLPVCSNATASNVKSPDNKTGVAYRNHNGFRSEARHG